MSRLSLQQVIQYAQAAGFTGDALITAVSIADAESGFDPTIHNPGHAGDKEDSWGLWQINLLAHPQYSVSQATNPRIAAQIAYTLSDQGTDFTPWTTYRTGDYKQTATYQQLTSGGVIKSITKWTLADSQATWPWLFPLGGDRLNPYNPPDEQGIDLGMDLHTEITSLTLGTVVTTGYFGGGGVVCIVSYVPYAGGIAVVYYQHLDVISVKTGQIVRVGDLIGLSGGQLTGGVHPVTCCSTGPHIETGLNPLPGKGDNGQPLWVSYGPNKNPLPWLQALVAYGPPARDLAGGVVKAPLPGTYPYHPGPNPVGNLITFSDQAIAGVGPVPDSFFGIEQSIDYALAFVPIDWTTISKNTHWWDYVLPWQWQYAANTDSANLVQAVAHNIGAYMLRTIIVMTAFIMLLAFFWGLLRSGSDQKQKAEAEQVAQAAQVAQLAQGAAA